jgi:DNA-binding beta-propeller fold protein YncE
MSTTHLFVLSATTALSLGGCHWLLPYTPGPAHDAAGREQAADVRSDRPRRDVSLDTSRLDVAADSGRDARRDGAPDAKNDGTPRDGTAGDSAPNDSTLGDRKPGDTTPPDGDGPPCPTGCLIGSTCHKKGDPDTLDACHVCEPALSRITWSPQPGCMLTLTGSPSLPAGATDGPLTVASFDSPHGIVWDEANQALYVSDENNACIRKIAQDRVTTLAGLCKTLGANVDGQGTVARFITPHGLALGASGKLYVADGSGSSIRIIDTSNGQTTTLVGMNHAWQCGNTNGPVATAALCGPTGVAVDSSGTKVYIADTFNHCIRLVEGGNVSTIAGQCITNGTPVALIDGAGTAARFNSPEGMAIGSSGVVYVADRRNYRVRQIDASYIVSTAAGTVMGLLPGPATTVAQLSEVTGVTRRTAGGLWIADWGNVRVRMYDGASVSFVAGYGGVGLCPTYQPCLRDGLLTGSAPATFNWPMTLAERTVPTIGTILYVADEANRAIRVVRP